MPEDWPPTAPDARLECDRCGHHVSRSFYRVWAGNDGALNGCRYCLPRSIRFGEDIYGREPEDIEDFSVEDPNRGRDPAPSSRLKDEYDTPDDTDETTTQEEPDADPPDPLDVPPPENPIESDPEDLAADGDGRADADSADASAADSPDDSDTDTTDETPATRTQSTMGEW